MRERKQTGKSLSLRIDLNYYKDKGWLYWSRWVCAGLAFVFVGIYATLVLMGSALTDSPVGSTGVTLLKRLATHVNTGPISQVHAHFEGDCHHCHTTGLLQQAIATDAFSFDAANRASLISEACQKCHKVQSHAQGSPVTDIHLKHVDQDCVHCHSEHNGLNVNLIAVDSKKCSQCHSKLNEITTDTKLNAKISEFSVESHSVKVDAKASLVTETPFRSLTQDTGRIKFDHAQHLAPGQVKIGNRGAFRTGMLPERWQGLYASQDGLVKLVCHDCHQLQSPSGPTKLDNLSQANTAVDSELSHFFTPIDFEKHCAACHQLNFTAQTKDMLPLPHAAPRDEIKRLLSAKLQGGKISGQISAAPDRHPDFTAREIILNNFEIDAAVESVYTRCNKCHEDKVASVDVFAQLHASNAGPLIPRQWLKLGLFNHGAHAKISECKDCHTIPAGPSGPSGAPDNNGITDVASASLDNKTVMIKGPESCVLCHRDPKSPLPSGTSQAQLAADDCRLCHRYHWSRPAQVVSDVSGNKQSLSTANE
jgi:Cytochrome c7 and related cytochrome c